MTSTTRFVTRNTGQQEIIMESSHGLPSIMGDFTAEPGLVRGHVAWTSDCERAIVNQRVTDEIKVDKPNTRAAIGSTIIGTGIGVLSAALISTADSFSDEQTCSTDNEGHYSCSSPRQNAIGLGVVGIITSAALVGTGLVTVASKPRTSIVTTEAAPPSVSRVTREHVNCGVQPVRSLGLALKRAGVTVAASSTNEDGEVAFAVPPTISGGLVVVVDAVPPPLANIRVGDIVGAVEMAP
jgi:hypothetical protein